MTDEEPSYSWKAEIQKLHPSSAQYYIRYKIERGKNSQTKQENNKSFRRSHILNNSMYTSAHEYSSCQFPNFFTAIYAIRPVLNPSTPSSISNVGVCSDEFIPLSLLPTPQR